MRIISAIKTATIAAFTFGLVGAASADDLADIKSKGSLTFGVKADSKPWAYVDTSGNPVGFEIEIAKAISEQIGVKPNFVTVTSANRIQFLEQGKIDVVLATMSDTEKRRKVVRMIEPHYFADATNVLFKGGTLSTWADVKGKNLCGVQGSFYNKWVAQEHGAQTSAYAGVPEAIAALKQGQCAGFIYADQILRTTRAGDDALKSFTVGLEPVNPDYWAMAVSKEPGADSLASTMSSIMTDLHKSGTIMKFANEFGFGENPFLNASAK